MLLRCGNPDHPSFYLYGGRGITVCSRWNDFRNFIKDMGEPSARQSLDRINVNGNYEPSNCRWSDNATQNKNRRAMMAIESFPDSVINQEYHRRFA